MNTIQPSRLARTTRSSRAGTRYWRLAGWLCLGLVLPAAGIEPRLTGPAAPQADTHTLDNIRQQVHAVAGHEAAEIWRCDCRYCLAMAHCDELGFIEVYLTPRPCTPRLLRGEWFRLTRCPHYRRPDEAPEPFGGWSIFGTRPSEYAVVAAPGQTLSSGDASGDPARLKGEWTDEDVLATVDALRQTVSTQNSFDLERTDMNRARAEGVVKTRKGWRNFTVDFRRVGDHWQATTRKPRWEN